MSDRSDYMPGAAAGAHVEKDGERWTLVLVRDLKHPPARVWEAITEPEHLRAWAPFDADRSLAGGGTVKLTTVGAPQLGASVTQITRAEVPRLLEYAWGGQQMRWQLEPSGSGTRLSLWHSIDRNYIAMGAAGWHICFDVMDRHLAGSPLGRIVAGDAMKHDFKRLMGEYAASFAKETK